jgi:5-methylcytosine-specific restriction endonuclease McrA
MRLELERCLTLNKSWQTIGTVDLRKAMKIVFRSRGRVVDPETYQLYTWDQWVEEKAVKSDAKIIEDKYIKTQSLWIRKPEVVVLGKFAGYPNKGLPFSRRGVHERDNYQCQFCGKFLHRKSATIDHVRPVSKGGITSWLNCVTSCQPCNSKKSNRTPEESGMPLRNQPFKPTKKQLILKGVTMLESWKPFLSKEQLEMFEVMEVYEKA